MKTTIAIEDGELFISQEDKENCNAINLSEFDTKRVYNKLKRYFENVHTHN